MQRWEYLIGESLRADPPEVIMELLDNLGRVGWELVCIDRHGQYLFKRPLAEPPAPPPGPPPPLQTRRTGGQGPPEGLTGDPAYGRRHGG